MRSIASYYIDPVATPYDVARRNDVDYYSVASETVGMIFGAFDPVAQRARLRVTDRSGATIGHADTNRAALALLFPKRRTAVGLSDNGKMILSFPAHLNAGRIPELSEVKAILRGDTVTVACALFNSTPKEKIMSVSLIKTEAPLNVAHRTAYAPTVSNAALMSRAVATVRKARLAALVEPGAKVLTTRADALELIRLLPRGRMRIFIHVRIDAVVPSQPGHVYRDMFNTSLPMTRKQANEFVNKEFRDYVTEKGAALAMTVTHWKNYDAMDRKTGNMVKRADTVVLWIGG